MAGEHIESCWTSKGFNDRFDEIMKENNSNPDFKYIHAYIRAEEEHIKKFGFPLFSSYDSFRHTRKKIIFGT